MRYALEYIGQLWMIIAQREAKIAELEQKLAALEPDKKDEKKSKQ